MKRLFYTFSILSLFLILFSCNSVFEGDYENTPEGNFDFFFNELDQIYAYKDYTFTGGRSLQQIKDLEKARLTANPTWNNLSTVLSRVIYEDIRDHHLYPIYSPVEGSIEISNDVNRIGQYDEYFPFYSLDAIPNFQVTRGKLMDYGIYTTNNRKIGYIYVRELVSETVGGQSRLQADKSVFGDTTDEILKSFQSSGVGSVIIDIRSYAGGAVYNGKEIAGRFVTGKHKFMLSDYQKSAGSFERVEEYFEPQGYDYYQTRPLMVIVNNNTCSGGEMLTLMLKKADGLIQVIGTPTRGCAGIILDFDLPNGWAFRATASRTYTAEGVDYFKTGIVPDVVQVVTNQIQGGFPVIDNVLQTAINVLATNQP